MFHLLYINAAETQPFGILYHKRRKLGTQMKIHMKDKLWLRVLVLEE